MAFEDPPPVPASAEHASLELDQFIPYRLSVLSNRISTEIAGRYQARFGLSITEWRTMAVLGRYPDLSANEVSERTAMDKVAISRAVARLLERGLIRRAIHGEDRRRSVLRLSDAGYSVYDEVAPMTLACERSLLAPLTDDERETLWRLIDKLGSAGMDEMLRNP